MTKKLIACLLVSVLGVACSECTMSTRVDTQGKGELEIVCKLKPDAARAMVSISDKDRQRIMNRINKSCDNAGFSGTANVQELEPVEGKQDTFRASYQCEEAGGP